MKKSKRTKKALSLSLCAMMVISMCQLPTYALEGEEPEQAVVDETSNETTEEAVIEDEKETTVSDQTEETVEKEVETAEEPAEPSVIYPDGVTVEADENSRTGYTAHFVYDPVNNNGTTIQIDDPANPSPCRDNEANSDSATGDITHSIVYGKWDAEKQSKSPNLDYMTPYEGANKGTLEYVSYKGTINDHQDIGVYLPAGYDANREEPYKVIYLSHGAGGNETYWFSQPQAVNVMDHVIAENPEQEAIIVGMDNTLYGWNYEEIGKNVVNNVIPFIEAHYNVSTDPEDRAFAGFSMGAMTTTYMAFHHADAFGYFGILSGCNIGNATFKEEFEYDGLRLRGEGAAAYLQEVYENIEASEDTLNSLIFTMAGNVDTAVFANGFGYYGAYETIRDWCAEYMPEGNFIDGGLVPGSHDIYTWGQCLYNFAKDVVWTKDVNPDTPDTPDTPNHSVNTGDRSNLSFYVATTCVAVLAAGCILVSKRRKHS